MEFVHPDDRNKTATTAERIQPGLELLSFTNRYIAKDGTTKTLHWRAIVSAESGRYYTSARDLTDVLKSRERSAALDAVCELSDAAILMQDVDGTITRWDGAAEALFGHATAAMLGRNLSDFLFLAPDAPGIDLIHLAEDGLDEGVEAWFRAKDGDAVAVELWIREFGNGATPVTGAVARMKRAGA